MSLPELKPKLKTPLDLDLERGEPKQSVDQLELAISPTAPEANFGAAVTASSIAAFDRFFFELSQKDRRITRKRVVSALLAACDDPQLRALVIARLNK